MLANLMDLSPRRRIRRLRPSLWTPLPLPRSTLEPSAPRVHAPAVKLAPTLPTADCFKGVASFLGDGVLSAPQLPSPSDTSTVNFTAVARFSSPAAGIAQLEQGPLYDRARISRRDRDVCGQETSPAPVGDQNQPTSDPSWRGKFADAYTY